MNDKRAAIELSMNFLVVIIISIVLLGMGITFGARLFAGAYEKKAEVDKATQERIEDLLSSSGEPVIIPITKKDISPGDSDVFGLGIRNTQPTKPFSISVVNGTAINKAGAEITNWYNSDWKVVYERSVSIEQNQKKVVPILVGVPKSAADGTYSFTVSVDNGVYGKTKIFVEVS